MAKDKAKAKESKKASKANDDEDEAKPEFKYGVTDIAEELGIKPASVRVQLRNKGIEKAGKSYGWNSKSELKEVIDQIRSGGDDDEDEAPKGKKAKAEKPSKKDKKNGNGKASKKAKKDEDDEDDD